MKPLVSVVIPVYNRPELLVRSLRSVASQTVRDLEILVVDDGSTLDIRPSLSQLDDPRIRLLQHPNRRGVSSARNTGMDAARGQYVAFLDSDDYWRDRKLERQLAFMGATQNVRPVSCTAFTIKTMRNPDGDRRHSAETCTHKSLQVGCGVSPGSTLVGTAAFLWKIGPFNEAMSRLEDWEFLLRCTSEGPIPILGEDLAVIDCRHRDPAQYERTRDSAHTLRKIHAQTLPSLLQRRRFESYAEREIAASAYNDGRYWVAAKHFGHALVIFPWIRIAQLRSLIRRVFHDALRMSA